MRYHVFRQISHIGQYRAWSAAKADHRADPQEPRPRQIHEIIKDGSWADQARSYERRDRYSRVRRTLIETTEKQRRQRARRANRQLRERSRNISIFH